jgi:NAD(P)H-hydrate epimerase
LAKARTSTNQRGEAITSTQMYEIERAAHSQFGVLRVYMMENAGHGLADFIRDNFKKRGKGIIRVTAICGSGNNGGDALVSARHLSGNPKYRVTVLLLCCPSNLRTSEAKLNWDIITKMSSIESSFFHKINDKIEENISKADVIIDGIFGTGVRKEVTEPYTSAIRYINRSNAYVVAVDIPSGLDPNTGAKGPVCIKADATVTFHRPKVGLLKNKSCVGRIHIEPIGIPPESEKNVLR